MRVLLAQVNTVVGDVAGNLRKSMEALAEAKRRGCDLLMLPEQTLLGYPAKDLLLQSGYIRRNEEAVWEFARATRGGPAAIIGFAESHRGAGHGLYNSAAFCRDGRVEGNYRKWLLPTYDVFDEDRYFDEGRDCCLFEVAGLKCSLTICEDAWNDELYWSHRLYDRDPVAESARSGAQVLLNSSASPFVLGKRQVRRSMLSAAARRHNAALLQVNPFGANDDLIFDGGSSAYSPDGELISLAKHFAGDLLEIEVKEQNGRIVVSGPAPAPDEPRMEELRRALALGIRDYAAKCGFKKALIGLSGGIDSALVACLAVDALGAANVHGVAMPSRNSSQHSKDDARALAEALGIEFSMISIDAMFQTGLAELAPHIDPATSKLAIENMQARLRGLTLMTMSNASGALVLSTGNKSEMSVGYCTMYGDMCGGLSVIADVPKMMVYELSRHINAASGRDVIPKSTLTKAPSAELAPDQKDSDSLPPYEVLDPIVRGYVEESLDEEAMVARGFDEATVRRVYSMVNRAEYKRRQAAPSLKVTSRAFGYGWRMPIARR